MGGLQVGKKRQPTSLEKVSNNQKLDTAVDRKFHNDQYSASFFSKIISRELSQGSINDLYLCCRKNFSSNVVQTKAPQFVDLGLLDVNTSNELGVLSTPAIRIIRPTDGSNWSVTDHVFGRVTAVGMSAARS